MGTPRRFFSSQAVAHAGRAVYCPRMNSHALLIFDLDGTLYQTESSFLSTMHRVYEEYGVSAPPDAEIMGKVGDTFPCFIDWLMPQGFGTDRKGIIERIARDELAAIQANGRLFPGVRETLGALHAAGHTIALCTNGDSLYAKAVLEATGILQLFERLQTLEGDGRNKTSMIAELRQFYPRGRTFMVGDRHHDVAAGRANGCIVVAATYGYGTETEIAEADHRIDRFEQLLDLV